MKRIINTAFFLCVVFLLSNAINAQTKNKSSISTKIKSTTTVRKKTQKQKSKEVSFSCDLPASVTALDLSHNEITLNCPKSGDNCIGNKIVKVKTVAIDTGEMKYVYAVSAGKIIGEGADVEWDLSDVKPGTYMLTAGISQPISGGKSWQVLGVVKTATVIIKE